MTSQNSNNIPQERTASSSDPTVLVFDQYYQPTINLNNDELIVMTGFFQKRGFDDVAAESTAITILKQAKKDNYNPMEIMGTLKGLTNVAISGLVAEILNYNRFKTSLIGVTQKYLPSDEVARNILL
jgi:hypothetical protein